MTVRKKRRVQQDGRAFEGYQYIDPTLAAYVGEDVLIRYDPADMSELRVFFEERSVCRAICPELSGETVSLKEIVAARTARRSKGGEQLRERRAVARRLVKQEGVGERGERKDQTEEASQGEERSGAVEAEGKQRQEDSATGRAARVHLKRYRNE